MHDACPRDVCPTARRAEVEAARGRAELYGPLSVALGAAGVVAAGVGVYLIVRTPSRDVAILVPMAFGGVHGAAWVGHF